MNKTNMSRRGFLKASGLTAAGAVALSLTGMTIAPNTWAMTLAHISTPEGQTLSRLCRVLYPHSHLEDMYYDACVEGLDSKAAHNQNLLDLLKNGVAQLDSTYNTPFLKLSADQQLDAVKKLEGSPFFNTVRGHVVVALYNNEKIWMSFGYEGPSYPHGGYLDRGVNDIDWLPKN